MTDISMVEQSRRRARDWCDALIASDPSLNRLARALFDRGRDRGDDHGRVWVRAARSPAVEECASGRAPGREAVLAVAAQHHAVTLITMLLGGIIGMVGNFAMSDVARRELAITLTGMPLMFLSMLAISLELAPHRAVGLVGLALLVLVGFGTYLRKFAPRLGPRVVMHGLLLFIGYFFGFIAGPILPIGQIYWLAAILWLAVLVNLALRLTVFDRVALGTLSGSRRAFAARARGVIVVATAAIEAPRS